MKSIITPLAMFSVLPICFAQESSDRIAEPIRLSVQNKPSPIRTTAAVQSMLDKPVKHVQWDNAPFSEVIAWAKNQETKQKRVNVLVKWRALATVGIDEDTFVTLEMVDTSVREVLEEVFDQLSGLDPLKYQAIGNRLRISTQSDFNRRRITRLYEIEDVLAKIRKFRGAPQIDLSQQQQTGGGTGAGGQGVKESIFGTSSGGGEEDDRDDEADDQQRAQEIIDWIRTTVQPGTWDVNGGLGSVVVINNMLSVYNTLEVHREIGGTFHLER